MDWWLLSFFLGAILSLLLPIVPDLFYLFLFLSIALLMFSTVPLRKCSGLFFAMAWMMLNAYQYQHTWLNNELHPLQLAKKSKFVVGNVVSIPKQEQRSVRFNFKIDRLNKTKLSQPFIVRLRWNNANFIPEQGQKLQLKVKFKPAHGLANLGGFSYQAWLRQKNIVATGYVKKSKDNVILSSDINIRQQLFNHFSFNLPKHSLSAFLQALAFGEKSSISSEQWQVLKATGTQHLIAISGLHLGLVASGSYILSLFIINLLPVTLLLSSKQQAALLLTNVRYLAIFISLSLTFCYAYLADFSLPTVRALLMLFLYWSARLLGLKFSLKRWLLLTLFLLVISSPFSLFSASFWLSFYAVTLIFITLWRFSHHFQAKNRLLRFVKTLLIIQLALTIFLLPLTALIYQQVSLVAFFANLLAVPIMSFITIPLCLLALVFLSLNEFVSQFFMLAALKSLEWVWQWLTLMSEQQFSLVSLSNLQANSISVVIFIIAVTLYFPVNWSWLFTHKHLKIVVGSLFISSVFGLFIYFEQTKHSETAWQVNVLDVGQGLSVVIQKNGRVILYDTGAAFPSGFNMVEAAVLPYLQHQGITSIDKVIISHSDNDHAGGEKILAEKIAVKSWLLNYRTNAHYCLQGQSFLWQGLTFSQLWPQKIVGEGNDDSCVIHISDGKQSVLLTGDISTKVELQLISAFKKSPQKLSLTANVLIAPHHGSKTSSSRAFIKAVAAKTVVFSSGFLNRWQMPVQSVVDLYQQENMAVYNTAVNGMVKISFENNTAKIIPYRQNTLPYWFAN